MTFDEFKIRVNDFKMKLEYTNENTLTKDLFELNNLIESIKDEPFYNPRCGSAIKNEIKDMDSYEYGINGKMSKYFFYGSLLCNFAPVHHYGSVCNFCHQAQVMGNENYSHIRLLLQFFD